MEREVGMGTNDGVYQNCLLVDRQDAICRHSDPIAWCLLVNGILQKLEWARETNLVQKSRAR